MITRRMVQTVAVLTAFISLDSCTIIVGSSMTPSRQANAKAFRLDEGCQRFDMPDVGVMEDLPVIPQNKLNDNVYIQKVLIAHIASIRRFHIDAMQQIQSAVDEQNQTCK